MKLDRLMSGALAVLAVALACGCSSTPSSLASVRTAQNTPAPAVDPNVVGTTNLMSAEMTGPAPKVGKAHLANDDDSIAAEKREPKRSDGSRRGGGFGSSK